MKILKIIIIDLRFNLLIQVPIQVLFLMRKIERFLEWLMMQIESKHSLIIIKILRIQEKFKSNLRFSILHKNLQVWFILKKSILSSQHIKKIEIIFLRKNHWNLLMKKILYQELLPMRRREECSRLQEHPKFLLILTICIVVILVTELNKSFKLLKKKKKGLWWVTIQYL